VAEAFAPLNRTTATVTVTTLAAGVISLAAGIFFTRRVVAPLQALTEGAVRIANGDLSARVAIRRADEIGTLAETFNRMSDDLRISYLRLEATAEARARQLAAAADMSRAAAARLSLEPLLARVEELIRERFGYDHISIFLLDPTGKTAVLHEATGRIGTELKSRGFSLPVGSTSFVGWTTVTGTSRIAVDVSLDPLYYREDQLADVRSEATFPLRIGERIIGALDLQSRQPDAFAPDDAEVLQILADQIAVAVENSRLFARQQRVLQLEELVLSLSNKIHQTFQLDTILESAATELGRALGARRAVVRLSSAPTVEPGAHRDNGDSHPA
jgi:GAF domain-containing protein/HAMP domain-containing protein